jgi:uncharacterized damage-inducible protein DinB
MRDPMIAFLRGVLRRSYDGSAWHGPALAEVLDGVSAHDALAGPVPGAHTILELTHHLDAWTREVTRRLGGAPAAMPTEGDWPAPLAPDADVEARWRALRDRLGEGRDALLAAVADFPPARLHERVGTSDDPALGEQATFAAMLVGLAEHNAYHGGQIMLLRRALGG